MLCTIKCVVAVQCHPRSLISVPIESAYVNVTSCWWSIATLVLSWTLSEIRQLICRKTPIFVPYCHLKLSLGGEPFRISESPCENSLSYPTVRFCDCSVRRFDTMPACNGRTDGQTASRPLGMVIPSRTRHLWCLGWFPPNFYQTYLERGVMDPLLFTMDCTDFMAYDEESATVIGRTIQHEVNEFKMIATV